MTPKKICTYHPTISATNICFQCKQPICKQCDGSGLFISKRYCRKCADDIRHRFPVRLQTSPTLINEIEKLSSTDFSHLKGELQTPFDITHNIKVGMGLWFLVDWLAPKFHRDIYAVSILTRGRNTTGSPQEFVSLSPKELIREYQVQFWFLWLFMPKKRETNAAKVTFGVIYEDTGHEYILGFVTVRKRPTIAVIDVGEYEYDKAKEIARKFGCKINWKSIKEYRINSNAFAGGDGREAFFPYLIS